MGDKDDLSMDDLMEQLRNLTGSDDKVSPIRVQPWDDAMLTPDAKKFSAKNWNYDPDSTISEKADDDVKYKIEITDGTPTPLASNKQGSVIRALEEALKGKGTTLGKKVNLPADNGEKTVTITKNTEAGVADLKKVHLDDLCGFVDSDVDVNSAGGEYLVDLYRGYELMIKRIIERYPKPSAKNPADYVDREIFDSISGIMEEDAIAEVIFDLTGEDEIDGGIEAIADLVFEGLNNRFIENSGWGDGGDSVTLIQRPIDPNVATSRKPFTAFKDLDFSEKPLIFDRSGSMGDTMGDNTKYSDAIANINKVMQDFLDEKDPSS